MNKKLILATALAAATSLSAQTLTLDSCRALALRNNKQLRMSALKIEAAHWQHKSAQSNYYPRITAVGTYQRTSREVQLLSDEQQDRLVHIGTNAASAIRNGVHQGVADFQQGITQLMSSPQMAQMLGTPEMAQMLQQNPLLLQLISNPSMIGQLTEPMLQRAATAFNGMLTSMESLLNSGGQSIVDAFRTDTRNMTGATIMLTQPLYMGGKIRAYDKITRLAEEAAGAQHTSRTKTSSSASMRPTGASSTCRARRSWQRASWRPSASSTAMCNASSTRVWPRRPTASASR